MTAQAYNPSTQEAEVAGSQIQDQPGLHWQLQAVQPQKIIKMKTTREI
jgi:hypothetical protein